MRTVLALAFATAALVACDTKPRETYVDGAWVRLAAVKGQPAAAYFTIHGGPTGATLINVSTDVVIRSEMHDGGADMRLVRSVVIPADGAVAFAPGGRHVMLYDVNPGIKPGSSVTFTFTFANGLRILQNAAVIAAGDAAPK